MVVRSGDNNMEFEIGGRKRSPERKRKKRGIGEVHSVAELARGSHDGPAARNHGEQIRLRYVVEEDDKKTTMCQHNQSETHSPHVTGLSVVFPITKKTICYYLRPSLLGL